MRSIHAMGLVAAMVLGQTTLARAQGPVVGQPYQIPAELAGVAAGSIVNYGGYNYVIQGNRTMLPYTQTYSSYYVQPGSVPMGYARPVYVQQWYTQPVYSQPWYGQPGYSLSSSSYSSSYGRTSRHYHVHDVVQGRW